MLENRRKITKNGLRNSDISKISSADISETGRERQFLTSDSCLEPPQNPLYGVKKKSGPVLVKRIFPKYFVFKNSVKLFGIAVKY